LNDAEKEREANMKRMQSILCCTVLVIISLVSLAGCTTYYRVTDPSTDNVYYSTSVKKLSGGAVRIKDEKTGKDVTLQNSEVETVKKEQFKVGIYGE
jgi:hypothetical protein